MTISRDEVLRVAELAQLELTPEEIETYRSQLNDILDYVGKLNALDLSDVEPMSQVLYTSPESPAGKEASHPELRDDILVPCDIANEVLAGAPDAAKPFFRVPKVIDR
jgi:aspartyl-tRNA(Asn)/glutamyl-tRNA(Gln) amidotransferase subunit C